MRLAKPRLKPHPRETSVVRKTREGGNVFLCWYEEFHVEPRTCKCGWAWVRGKKQQLEPPEAVPLLAGEQAVQGSRKMQPTVVGIHISLPSPVQRPLGRVVEGGPSSLPRWQTRV